MLIEEELYNTAKRIRSGLATANDAETVERAIILIYKVRLWTKAHPLLAKVKAYSGLKGIFKAVRGND